MKVALTSTPSASQFAPIVVRGNSAEAFALAAKLGYDGVEVHLRRPEDVDGDELVQLTASYGLAIPTLGTGMIFGEDRLGFADPDPAVRRAAVERIKGHTALAARVGSAVTIGLVRGQLGKDPAEQPRRFAYFQDCLKECCETAARVGVTLILEPINRYESDFIHRIEEAREIIERMGAPNLKMLIDTFHMNIEEVDLAQSIRVGGGLIGHVHLVDSNREAPGHGHVDMAGVIAALDEVGYAGFLSFEVLPRPNPEQAAHDGIAFVRPLLGTRSVS